MRRIRSATGISAILAVSLLAGSQVMAQTQDTTGYLEMMQYVFSPVCLHCHHSNLPTSVRNGAPESVNFNTYTLAKVNAINGNARVQAGTMPPAPFSDTLIVSDTGKATFQAWVDNGTPLGTVVDYQQLRTLLFEPICMKCHSSTVSNRNGAPSNVNWDTYAAARTSAVRGNLRIQAGSMPPATFSPRPTAAQKAAFQNWVWLGEPSGDFVSFATLEDTLFSKSCLFCHDVNKTGSARNGAPDSINLNVYASAAANAAKINNRVQSATSAPHGPQIQTIKDLVFNWVYAGTPENDPVAYSACDLDSSGTVESTDVIWLLLYVRDNAFDETYDWNGDGKFSISDVVALILAIRNGTCGEAGSLLAAAGGSSVPEWLSELSADDVAYVESMLGLLGLTPGEEAAIRLALHGETGRATLPLAFSLSQNSPNPFNPATTISYTVPEGTGSRVRIEVFDTGGRLVATLVDRFEPAGSYTVFWDGTNGSGVQVSSGVYFYRMSAGQFITVRKMVLLK